MDVTEAPRAGHESLVERVRGWFLSMPLAGRVAVAAILLATLVLVVVQVLLGLDVLASSSLCGADGSCARESEVGGASW
ncbi:hypothetical protein [Nocardioides sp. SYSU D00038]|uniref:hypothetical protein n=1 Tax=Nocardioides sp. SYSU D00038 TaxID=2812554 RepID=UPI0019685419|nr:hypothetical protein [Nocardioides sp. SYSU D00038]